MALNIIGGYPEGYGGSSFKGGSVFPSSFIKNPPSRTSAPKRDIFPQIGLYDPPVFDSPRRSVDPYRTPGIYPTPNLDQNRPLTPVIPSLAQTSDTLTPKTDVGGQKGLTPAQQGQGGVNTALMTQLLQNPQIMEILRILLSKFSSRQSGSELSTGGYNATT